MSSFSVALRRHANASPRRGSWVGMRRLLAVSLLLACGRTDTAVPVAEAPPLPPLLSSLVQKKARALTLDVSKGPSVAAWAQASDHVDVLATFLDHATGEHVTRTLVQNVVVLKSVPGALTVLVMPEEAELLTHAAQDGTITVVLRNEDDLDVVEERGRTTAGTLLSGERTRVLQQKRFNTIQVIRGSASGSGSGAAPAPEPETGLITQPAGVNGVVATAVEATSTFAADVDTASWTLARAQLLEGRLPDPGGVRVEELVNAFDYGYRAPQEQAFGVSVEAFPSPSRPGWHLLSVGVQGRRVEPAARKDANLVFTLDVSGSMSAPDRLELAKRALVLLAGQLRERDTVALVVYGSEARLVLAPTPASQRERIVKAIESLATEGSTNVQAGLELAYATALKGYKAGGINRVVLCSDGVANNGITDADGIFARVKKKAQEGITLTAVGFGMGSYNDALMERLADQGDGQYAYVDRLEEARRIFVEELTGTLQLIAKDVKLQLEFDPATVEQYRLVGFENRMLAKQDFANDKVDAGDIGAGHAMTALYEVKLKPQPGARLATFRARYKEPGTSASGLIVHELPSSVVRERVEEAGGAARLAATVALFAEKLRHSPWAAAVTWAQLQAQFSALPAEVRASAEVAELGRLISTAARLDAKPRG